jgi:hypothetical protein
MLARLVGVPEVIDFLREVAEEEDILFADLACDFDLGFKSISCFFYCESRVKLEGKLTLAPSQVPMIRPPFSTNFMLLVPDAL